MSEYMNRAIELAEIAYSLGEVPVGAVVVRKTDGEIVGEGYNLRESEKKYVTAHSVVSNKNTLIMATKRRLRWQKK